MKSLPSQLGLPIAIVASLTVSGALARSVLIPLPTRTGHAYDPLNHTLYITTTTGDLQRYDVATQTLLAPWHLGPNALYGVDFTPDGSKLVVGDNSYIRGQPVGYVDVVQTDSGALTRLTFERKDFDGSIGVEDYLERGSYAVSVVSNTRAYFTSVFAGIGDVPLREIDLSANTVTERGDVPSIGGYPAGPIDENTTLVRSADRSQTMFKEFTRPYLGVLDTASNHFTATAVFNSNSIYSLSGVSRDGNLFAVEARQGQQEGIQVYDKNLQPLTFLGSLNGGFVFDPTRDVMYAVDSSNDLLLAISTQTWQGLYALPIEEDVSDSGLFDAGVMSMKDDGSTLFLSTPSGIREFSVPEPAACAVAGAAGLGLLIKRRARRRAPRLLVVLTAVLLGAVLPARRSSAGEVLVGQSSLIGQYDYGDTFTVTGPPGSQVGPSNLRPDGYSGSNVFGSYNLEQHFMHPISAMTPVGVSAPFGFVTPPNAPRYFIPGVDVTESPSHDSGIFHTGNGAMGLPLGFRDDFIVQFDGRNPQGGLAFGSYAHSGDNGFQNGDLTISIGDGGAVSLGYSDPGGMTSYGTQLVIPAPGHDWRNYAVEFDKTHQLVRVFVDEASQGVIDLAALPPTSSGFFPRDFGTGGIAFGASVTGGNDGFFDNLQVGAPLVPEPSTCGLMLAASLLPVLRRRYRRRHCIQRISFTLHQPRLPFTVSN